MHAVVKSIYGVHLGEPRHSLLRQPDARQTPRASLVGLPQEAAGAADYRAVMTSPRAITGLPKVVILCGGLGTRMREETEYRPKPMVEVGGRPLLWHIMKLYARRRAAPTSSAASATAAR